MARALPLLLLPLLMAAAACGGDGDAPAEGRSDTARQATAVGRDTAQARQELLRLEEELFQSFARGDTAPAARLLAADYIGVTGDGIRESKARMLANLRRDTTVGAGGPSDSIHVDSTTVRVYGDAAVAHTSGTYRRRTGRPSATVRFENTDMFVWRDGRWQIVATHLSQVRAVEGASRAR